MVFRRPLWLLSSTVDPVAEYARTSCVVVNIGFCVGTVKEMVLVEGRAVVPTGLITIGTTKTLICSTAEALLLFVLPAVCALAGAIQTSAVKARSISLRLACSNQGRRWLQMLLDIDTCCSFLTPAPLSARISYFSADGGGRNYLGNP